MGVEIKSIQPGDEPLVTDRGSRQKHSLSKTFPKKGDTVVVHYTGTLTNGKKFDSSKDRGKPFQTQIGLGQVIKGWDEAFTQLSKGEIAILTIPADSAYGSQGVAGVIGPNETLVFEVELLDVIRK